MIAPAVGSGLVTVVATFSLLVAATAVTIAISSIATATFILATGDGATESLILLHPQERFDLFNRRLFHFFRLQLFKDLFHSVAAHPECR